MMRLLTSASVATLLLLNSHVSADPPTFGSQDAERYDAGDYGFYPNLTFHSSDLIAARPIKLTWPEGCKSDDFFFIAPRGSKVDQTGPMILDNDGHMIWHSDYGHTYGFTVQEYKGKPYLTFWVGDDHVVGHGSGVYYMLDNEYNQFKKVDAKFGFHVDLHEFSITHDDTAVYSVYDNTTRDLTSVGKDGNGWVWDGLFQEMDLESGQVLFQWNASDHFTFDDVYYPVGAKGTAADPWDWFHVNSIEKDLEGNYLISSRYTHAISYISGVDGSVLWNLGGKNNDFQDLSDGEATNMAWQHMARWEDDYTAISIYDNHASSGPNHPPNTHPSRGMKVKLDFDKKTARLIGNWTHPRGHISESQGSVQHLPNGNYFVGFGAAAVISEFTKDGDLVCDMEYGAQRAGLDGAPSPAKVMSYRAFKLPWVGIPHYPPQVAFDPKETIMFVSWNGATEVRRWRLEAASSPWPKESDWRKIDEVAKSGFESNMTVDTSGSEYYRLTALDKYGKVHRQWTVSSAGAVQRIESSRAPVAQSLMYVIAGAAIALSAYVIYRLCRRVRGGGVKPWMAEQGPPGILSSRPRWAAFHPANISKIWQSERYADGEASAEQLPLKSRSEEDND